jgi:hypothetical protein
MAIHPGLAGIDLAQVEVALGIVAGLGGSLVAISPGWVLLHVYLRGVKGPEPSERAYLAQLALGGLLVHLLALAWTLQLASALIQTQARAWLDVVGWSACVLIIIPALLGAGFSWLSESVANLEPGKLRSVLTLILQRTTRRWW